jgi:hypothetical protein
MDRTGRPGLIRPRANQLLPVRGPKKSPARTISERTPSRLAASSCASISTRILPFRVSGFCGERSVVGHAWAYLPDVAGTIAQLLEREARLADFDVFHFGGHWFEAGIDMARTIQRVVGQPKPHIRRFPWAVAFALSPFVTVFREMLELRYLWQRPVRLDNAKLAAFLGAEPHTPIDDCVLRPPSGRQPSPTSVVRTASFKVRPVLLTISTPELFRLRIISSRRQPASGTNAGSSFNCQRCGTNIKLKQLSAAC